MSTFAVFGMPLDVAKALGMHIKRIQLIARENSFKFREP